MVPGLLSSDPVVYHSGDPSPIRSHELANTASNPPSSNLTIRRRSSRETFSPSTERWLPWLWIVGTVAAILCAISPAFVLLAVPALWILPARLSADFQGIRLTLVAVHRYNGHRLLEKSTWALVSALASGAAAIAFCIRDPLDVLGPALPMAWIAVASARRGIRNDGSKIWIARRFAMIDGELVRFAGAKVSESQAYDLSRTLTIIDATGRVSTILEGNFPSNARKAHKIEAARALKYEKVKNRILSLVEKASAKTDASPEPGADIVPV